MKTFLNRTVNLLSKKSISRQNIMNFVGEHPRLLTLLAGLGISFTFASVGRFFLSEAFALSSFTDIGSPVAVEQISKVSVDSVPGDFYNVFPNLSCAGCAEESMPEPFPEDKFPFDKFPVDKFPKKI